MTTPFVGKFRPLHPPCKASFATALSSLRVRNLIGGSFATVSYGARFCPPVRLFCLCVLFRHCADLSTARSQLSMSMTQVFFIKDMGTREMSILDQRASFIESSIVLMVKTNGCCFSIIQESFCKILDLITTLTFFFSQVLDMDQLLSRTKLTSSEVELTF